MYFKLFSGRLAEMCNHTLDSSFEVELLLEKNWFSREKKNEAYSSPGKEIRVICIICQFNWGNKMPNYKLTSPNIEKTFYVIIVGWSVSLYRTDTEENSVIRNCLWPMPGTTYYTLYLE